MLNYQRVDLVTQGFFHPKDLNTVNLELVGGIPTPLKNMKVNWDDDIPNIWKVIKFHVSNHQPVMDNLRISYDFIHDVRMKFNRQVIAFSHSPTS